MSSESDFSQSDLVRDGYKAPLLAGEYPFSGMSSDPDSTHTPALPPDLMTQDTGLPPASILGTTSLGIPGQLTVTFS